MAFSFLPMGAIIKTFKVKGLNIVLGFPKQEDYVQHNAPYFGETIGRSANRIKGAQIDDLNGQSYPLSANNGPNSLHGGAKGWGKHIWEGPKVVETRQIPGVDGFQGTESVQFSRVSQHLEEGYPGTVEVTVTYTSGTQDVEGKEATVLGIEYEARLVDGADATAINLTNHSYFNLTGDETISGTVVTLATNKHLPIDAEAIPTGGPSPYPDLDTTKPFVLQVPNPDVDHCFIMNTDPASVPIDTRSLPLALNVQAFHPKTGIHLEVLSTEPAFQFYTGRFISVPAVDGAPARDKYSGFCCEPSRWVNAINVPEWKNMAVLKKGEVYGARIVYKAWAADE